MALKLRSYCPDLIWRALPWLIAVWAALVIAGISPFLVLNHMDFDLYYFGGLIERSDSYTNTTAVLYAANEAHRFVAADGVFGSPTLVGLVFQPLSLLPLDVALSIWRVAAVLLMAFAVRRAVGDRWWPAWFAIALLSTSNVLAFAIGNFAFVTTALLLFAYGSFRTGKSKQGGIALAFAIAFKLYPVFLLLPLIFKREKQALTWTLAPLAILLAVTPFTLGYQDTLAAVRVTLEIASFVHSWSDNDGIPGTVLRATDNQTLARWTARIGMIAAALLIYSQRSRRNTSELFALGIVALTATQGISWNMYYGVTIVVLLAARDRVSQAKYWIALALAYFLANGAFMRPTYDLFNLPRGVPVTIGLVAMLILAIAQPAFRRADKQAVLP